MENTPILHEPHGKSPDEMRASILKLESVMRAMREHQVEIKTTHTFAPGIYLREILIPKGTTLTGKIHKTEHLCILSLGEVSVWNGEGVKRIKASSVIQSPVGVKRVIFAHEDSVWISVHATQETDIEKIEEMLIAKSFDELPAVKETGPKAPVVTWQGKPVQKLKEGK